MTIDHRHGTRQPLDMDLDLGVWIQHCDGYFARVKASNISCDGIYVRGSNLILSAGSLVALEIKALRQNWRITGCVVHQTGEGLGILFRDPQPELFDLLTNTPPSLSTPGQSPRITIAETQQRKL